MPHYLGTNRKIKIVTRKVFENLNRIDDQRAWQAACMEQRNDSWREVCVSKENSDPEQEYLRQWLLKNGAEENDEHVILGISW